jgi:hypothetical protein
VSRLLPGGSVDTSFAGLVNLAIKSGTGTAGAALGGTKSASAVAGTATFAPTIDTAGVDYQLTATSGLSVVSTKFTIFGFGDIACTKGTSGVDNYNSSQGQTEFDFDPDSGNAPSGSGWGLRRGTNYDGLGCVKVAYTFTPPSGPNNVASMLFDRTTGQAASWKYLITWPSTAVSSTSPTTGWTTFRPRVSWGIDNPNPAAGSTDYVPALFCTNDPGDISLRTASQLQNLLPNMPDDCALPGVPNNTASDGPFCKAAFARSDVYPLAGKAKMCVSQQGFTTGAGNTLFPWTEVVDQADAYITPGD